MPAEAGEAAPVLVWIGRGRRRGLGDFLLGRRRETVARARLAQQPRIAAPQLDEAPMDIALRVQTVLQADLREIREPPALGEAQPEVDVLNLVIHAVAAGGQRGLAAHHHGRVRDPAFRIGIQHEQIAQ